MSGDSPPWTHNTLPSISACWLKHAYGKHAQIRARRTVHGAAHAESLAHRAQTLSPSTHIMDTRLTERVSRVATCDIKGTYVLFRHQCTHARTNLGDLSAFMVPAQKGDVGWVARLQQHQHGEQLEAVVASINEISHENVVRRGNLAAGVKQAQQIVKLAMNVTAHLRQTTGTARTSMRA
eukprot:366444-Chlamydomonas_euryale.AAC.38